MPSRVSEAGSGTAAVPVFVCQLITRLSMPMVAGQSANVSVRAGDVGHEQPGVDGASCGVSSAGPAHRRVVIRRGRRPVGVKHRSKIRAEREVGLIRVVAADRSAATSG